MLQLQAPTVLARCFWKHCRYEKLMLRRIDWNARREEEEEQDEEQDGGAARERRPNYCHLVWQVGHGGTPYHGVVTAVQCRVSPPPPHPCAPARHASSHPRTLPLRPLISSPPPFH